MTEYKLMVLDLDGTLTNEKKEITPLTYKRLMQVQQRGLKVILASGRPTQGILHLAAQLELACYGGYILSYNGGKIIDCATGRSIYESVLPPEAIPHLYRAAERHGLAIVTYDRASIVTEWIDAYVEKEAMLNRMEVRQVDDFVRSVDFPVTKCLIMGESTRVEPLETELQAAWGETLNVFRSEPYFLELMPRNIDKAYSLSKLLDHLNLTPADMIACGDGFNDLSMIRFAGLGVAMANAQPCVKEAADYITLSNEEDGVAHVAERFILR